MLRELIINTLISQDVINTLYIPTAFSFFFILLNNKEKYLKFSLFLSLVLTFSTVVYRTDADFLNSLKIKNFLNPFSISYLLATIVFVVRKSSEKGTLLFFVLLYALSIPLIIMSASIKIAFVSAAIATVTGIYWFQMNFIYKNEDNSNSLFVGVLLTLISTILYTQTFTYGEMSEESFLCLIAAMTYLIIAPKELLNKPRYYFIKIFGFTSFMLLSISIAALTYFDR